jgi:hypothetical protein
MEARHTRRTSGEIQDSATPPANFQEPEVEYESSGLAGSFLSVNRKRKSRTSGAYLGASLGLVFVLLFLTSTGTEFPNQQYRSYASWLFFNEPGIDRSICLR